eukprot:2178822-Alexandrium_andersonii.AAC.1
MCNCSSSRCSYVPHGDGVWGWQARLVGSTRALRRVFGQQLGTGQVHTHLSDHSTCMLSDPESSQCGATIAAEAVP